jgi:anti-sigma factor RsiW
VSQADEVVERAAQTVALGSSRGGVGVAELTHGVVRNQFSEYLDGSIEPGDRHRVERHLSECGSCVAYLRTFRRTVELTGALPYKLAPAGAKAATLRRAQDEP